MSRDDVLEFCSAFPEAVEDYPFGDDVTVFKVGGRMFALVMLDGTPGFVNLKCDPDLALELRARYPAVRPGYHASEPSYEDALLWDVAEPCSASPGVSRSTNVGLACLRIDGHRFAPFRPPHGRSDRSGVGGGSTRWWTRASPTP